ncbi:MAG: alpha/beta hydrolase-fold protein, partial [Phycisphaerales bacterium]
ARRSTFSWMGDRPMTPHRLMTLVSVVSFVASSSAAVFATEPVTITFRVTAPDSTPADATLYLAGNHDALGAWRADGLALARSDDDDGVWSAAASFPVGAALEFKVTLGDWSRVEKSATGAEIDNRTHLVTKGETLDLTVASWADPSSNPPRCASTKTGAIRHHPNFASERLGRARDLWVYLPPGYDDAADERYPVLYFHDGQNLFDEATAAFGVEWGADEAAGRLIRSARIPPLIIVGIGNTPARMAEYTPYPSERFDGRGGEGDRYAAFLVDELKPFIDATYRTKPEREHTGVAGSSLGGLISLHLALTKSESFSRIGVVSPALAWADGRILDETEAHASRLKEMRLWIDMGGAEGQLSAGGDVREPVALTRRLVAILDDAGYAIGRDYYYLEVIGAAHNEAAWSQRVDDMLLYLYSER